MRQDSFKRYIDAAQEFSATSVTFCFFFVDKLDKLDKIPAEVLRYVASQ